MCWSSLSTASCRRLKVILFLDTNMLFHPKLMFCDESAAQLFLANSTVFLRKKLSPPTLQEAVKKRFQHTTNYKMQNARFKMPNAKYKIPFQFFHMLVMNKITCTYFRTSLPPRASRKQLTSCSSTSQNVKSHIPYLLNCVLASAICLFWIR